MKRELIEYSSISMSTIKLQVKNTFLDYITLIYILKIRKEISNVYTEHQGKNILFNNISEDSVI